MSEVPLYELIATPLLGEIRSGVWGGSNKADTEEYVLLVALLRTQRLRLMTCVLETQRSPQTSDFSRNDQTSDFSRNRTMVRARTTISNSRRQKHQIYETLRLIVDAGTLTDQNKMRRPSRGRVRLGPSGRPYSGALLIRKRPPPLALA